jgi:hypothetical protein
MGWDSNQEQDESERPRSLRLTERLARPKDPNQYRASVGQCPDGYHYDRASNSCVKTADAPPQVHVHLHGVGEQPKAEKKPEPKEKPKAEKKPSPAQPAAPVSKHPNLRKALGGAWHTVSHPFHAAWDLAKRPEARKELRAKIGTALKKEGAETKALVGTIGRAMKGEKISSAERSAAIAQTADLVKAALMTYAVGHIFAGGVVKALATLASPVDEIVGVALDKPLRKITEKVFGAAHGLLPSAFYESEEDPEAVLMKLVDEILDQMADGGFEDEDILAALSKNGMTPDAARRMGSANADDEEDDDVDEAAAEPPAFNLEGSLGIPREKMPQIAGDKIEDFLTYLRDECDLSVTKGERAAGNIKPTQDCVDPRKLGKMHDQKIAELTKNPLIVSSDTYLLDGHHRWAVVVQRKPSARWETREVDCTMKELLKHARDFDGAFTREYGESIDEGQRSPFVLLQGDPFA